MRWFVLFSFSAYALVSGEFSDDEQRALANIKACCEAQEIFHRTDYDRDGILEYAQHLRGGAVPLLKVDMSVFPEPSAEEKTKFEALIKKLGADDFETRQKASKELETFGPKAAKVLQAASETHKDVEILQRCKNLLDRLAAEHSPAPGDGQGLHTVLNNGRPLPLMLIDDALAKAECPLGSDPSKITDKNGYLFRLITKQGANAPGGARSYMVNRNGTPTLSLAYAFVAFPKNYGGATKRAFLISSAGTAYQKDFGDKEKTDAFIKSCDSFDPDKTWTPAE